MVEGTCDRKSLRQMVVDCRAIHDSFPHQRLDALPALSGLARAFQPVLKDEYLAGHWKKDIMASLMWSRNPKYPADESTRFDPTRPSEYLAPSWSWASILGNLSAMSNIWKTRDALAISALKVAQILDLHTVTKNYDPFGQVIGGELKMRGRFFPIEHLPPVWSTDNQFPDEPSDFLKLSPFQQIVYNIARLVDVIIYERYQQHKSHPGQIYGAFETIRWKGPLAVVFREWTSCCWNRLERRAMSFVVLEKPA